MRKILIVVVLLALLVFALVWGLTRPQQRPPVAGDIVLDERSIAKITTTLGTLRATGQGDIRLNEDEVNALARAYFARSWLRENAPKQRRDQGGWTLEVATTQVSDGVMTILLDLNYGKIPIDATFRGTPVLDGHNLRFDATSATIGTVPVPGFIAARLLRRALEDPRYAEVLTVRDEVRGIGVEGNEVVVSIAR